MTFGVDGDVLALRLEIFQEIRIEPDSLFDIGPDVTAPEIEYSSGAALCWADSKSRTRNGAMRHSLRFLRAAEGIGFGLHILMLEALPIVIDVDQLAADVI